MGLTMGQRKAVTREMANRYRRASKPQKAAMLDQFVKLHGCTRHHAGWLLRMWGKTVFERRDGELVKIVVGQRRPRRRGRRIYDEQVLAALKKIWYLFGCLCGKRLVAVLRTQLPVLEKFGELAVDPGTRRKLTRISAATVDRLLRTEKRALRIRGRSHTKPDIGCGSSPVREGVTAIWCFQEDARLGGDELPLLAERLCVRGAGNRQPCLGHGGGLRADDLQRGQHLGLGEPAVERRRHHVGGLLVARIGGRHLRVLYFRRRGGPHGVPILLRLDVEGVGRLRQRGQVEEYEGCAAAPLFDLHVAVEPVHS